MEYETVMRFPLNLVAATLVIGAALPLRAELRAGAAVTDITPETLPVLVNGGFLSKSTDTVETPLEARALVLDDGSERIALVVADSCMMPRPLLDKVKDLAGKRAGIRPDRILIAATHTHSAASCMGALGTDADPNYVPLLTAGLAESIVTASAQLEPVRVGWAVADAGEFTASRRWVRRPDRVEDDPFGNPTVRANMHAARNRDNVTGPSGPEDPGLSLLSLQRPDGSPFAVFASFSMHYFGDKPLSADYFGHFCKELKKRLAPDDDRFLAMLGHGCSGDIWRHDYEKSPDRGNDETTIHEYASQLASLAVGALNEADYRGDADLAMTERRLHLNYRVPDRQRLEWARGVVEEMGGRPANNRTEVLAREQILLHERQSTDVVLQALRIGEIGIATTPTETYALTGLKIKRQSPLTGTMVLDLTNGGDGYIPPPEQHHLGGYNTWAARTAGLEVSAEPRMTEALLEMLEEVSGKPRRDGRLGHGPAARAVLAAKPAAFWRLNDFDGPRAVDDSPHHLDANYEPGVVFFLPGPASERFCGRSETNRAAHFAGGRLRGRIPGLGNRYTVSLWFWNGMPDEAREISGWMFSRGRDHGLGPHGDHLGLGGSGDSAGRIVFQHGDPSKAGKILVGGKKISRWTWNHVILVRDGDSLRVHLNGELEFEASIATSPSEGTNLVFFGGRSDGRSNWEGRLDEISVFTRALGADEIRSLTAE